MRASLFLIACFLASCTPLNQSVSHTKVSLGHSSSVEKNSESVIIHYQPGISDVGGPPIRLEFYCPDSSSSDTSVQESFISVMGATAGVAIAAFSL